MAKRPEFDTDAFKAGLEVRKAVLGDAAVQRSLASADDFSAPLQQIITEYCWGNVWGRPGLDRKTRSFLNLAMLTALNRQHELRLHIRGALNNGVTEEELREVFIHAAVYCGAPAGLESTRIASEVLREVAQEKTRTAHLAQS
ncbi:MAG: carboxymuconolactone decarboxylase family protein [Beijerinckiaceae bacterium]